MIRAKSLVFPLCLVAAACGMSSQDLGNDASHTPPPASATPPAGPAPTTPPLPSDAPPGTTWEWLNPAPQGNRIRGIGGTANDDVWLVGDGNTALHWDGERWTDQRGTLRGVDLYSVFAAGPNDVWAAGDAGVFYRFHDYAPGVSIYTRHLDAGGGAILHFDGKAWTPDATIGTRWAHALWGTSSSSVFALLDGGDVARFDGAKWTVTTRPAGAVLRDMWGASASNAWAVGPHGTLAHFDGAAWSPVAPSGDPASDPAAPTNEYYGVWGSAADDVWAVFADQRHAYDGPKFAVQTIGFSHFDGSSWKIAQKEQTDITLEASYCPDTDEPLRLGHALWGNGPGRALATTRSSTAIWSYDGTRWSRETVAGGDWTLGVRSLWGAAGNGDLLAGGEAGALFRFDGSAATSRFTPVFDGYRGALRGLSVAGHEAWAVATSAAGLGELERWSAGGWTTVDLRAETHASQDITPYGVLVRSPTDVIVTGTHRIDSFSGMTADDVLHWDGASWTAMPPPPPGGVPFDKIWAPKTGGNPWMLGGDSVYSSPLYRFNGTAWLPIDIPGGTRVLDVSGSSDSDVWVLGVSSTWALEVFHFDGGTWKSVFHPSSGGGWPSSIRVVAPDDVWILTGEESIIGTPHVAYHFDGKTWTDRTDLDAIAIWPTGNGRAFYLSFDGADTMWSPSDVRHVLGYWDGQKSAIVGETSAEVSLLGGSDDALWIGGSGGATLRYALGGATH